MKTDALIDLLAQGAGPAPKAVVARRLLPAAALGLVVSAALSLLVVGPVPGSMYATPAPWIKLAYGAALAAAAGWWTARLAKPVPRVAGPTRAVAGVLMAMALLGALVLIGVPAGERPAALLGHSWLACPWAVALVSLPGLGAMLWGLRQLAPTRPRAAGFAAGLAAGALGATGYALACSEVSATFVAIWYTLGVLLTGLVGAWLGPRVLRW
jgi:hypothetical protein